ncbi:MAG: ABC transporter substrate-binding protein [Candidatus Poribacteria bacterium]|nr:ABC transporter substrate-binding protein [Candidatus Poribacteria bacterium]
MKNIPITLAVVFVLIWTLIGCDKIQQVVIPEKGVDSESTTLKIGFLASGSRTTYPNGAEIAISEINARGGLLGMPVELITAVGLIEAEAAVQVAATMIQDDDIIAILGPNRSSHAIPVSEVAQQHGVPMVTTTATNPNVTSAGDFVFMAAFTDAYQGNVMAQFAAEELGLTSVALLTRSGEVYTEGISEFFRTNFTHAGGTIAANVFYEENTTDFTEQLTRIAEGTPDALFVSGLAEEITLIAKQARVLSLQNAAGQPVLFLGADAWDNPDLLMNEEIDIEGSFFSGHFSTATDKPSGKAFVEAYRAAYGALLIGGHAVSYDAAQILIAAIERAGSLEGEAIREELAATKNYIGATDIAHYDENRHPTKSAVIFTIKNGKKQFYKQIDP